MNRPSSTDSRLTAWLEDGPTGGPDDALADALARVRSTRQRPGWLDRLTGDTMDTTWRARPVLTARLTFALLIAILVLALTAGTAIVGSEVIRLIGPDNGPDVLPAAALPPTACPAGTQLQSGDIATIAGTGKPGVSTDGGPATSASFGSYASTVAVDPAGAVYFVDEHGPSVRRVGTDGTISTLAGPATGATLGGPAIGIAFDADGGLLAMDWGASRIWRIDQDGKTTPIAGTGTRGAVVDGRPALQADITGTQLAVGPHGDLYFDGGPGFATIDTAGNIHAFAGTGVTGYTGDGGPATAAQLSDEIEGVVADAAGDVYLADANNHRIRKVDAAGVITTVVGTGVAGYAGDGESALDAQISLPMSLALGPDGSLYISDGGNSTIRRVDPTGIITTVAGTGQAGYSGDCGPASKAQLTDPYGIAIHDGVLYIVDGDDGGGTVGTLGGRIRIVQP